MLPWLGNSCIKLCVVHGCCNLLKCLYSLYRINSYAKINIDYSVVSCTHFFTIPPPTPLSFRHFINIFNERIAGNDKAMVFFTENEFVHRMN